MAQPVPDDYAHVIPYLTVDGAASAAAWYGQIFGATVISSMPAPDGRWIHGELEIGGGPMMVSDDFPEMNDGQGSSPGAVGGSPVTLHHFVADVDGTVAAAAEAGAVVSQPPTDMFWGDRFATITDPFGHRWSLATHMRDVTEEELAEVAESFDQ